MDYTTTGLISRVQRLAAIPPNAPGFDAATILEILNDELQAKVVPWLVGFADEYLVTYADTLIDGSTEVFPIPAKAWGGTLRAVKVVQKDGDTLDTDDIYEALSLVSVNDIGRADRGAVLRGDVLQLINAEHYAGKYLRMYYCRTPNALVAVTSARQITAVDSTGGTVTVASVPTGFSGQALDIIQGKPQFRVLGEDLTYTPAGGVLTLSAYPTGVAVGDWVAVAGETPIPTLPWPVVPLLAQYAALKCLESYPDAGGLSSAYAALDRLKLELVKAFTQRIKGSPKTVRARNDIWDCLA